MKTVTAIPLHSIKLVDRVKVAIPCAHDILCNEDCLCTAGVFFRFFYSFLCLRHPKDRGVPEPEVFLNYWANKRQASVSTH
jgi:hypothetical protein